MRASAGQAFARLAGAPSYGWQARFRTAATSARHQSAAAVPFMTAPSESVTAPARIEVRTPSATYAIEIQPGLIRQLGRALEAATLPRRRFVVSTATVWRLHGAAVAAALSLPPGEEPILIPDGERYKTVQTVGKIYDALVRASADRATTIIALGGGVVGDVAGFAAATYLRGV